jgi:hypothetical protein
LFVRQRAIEIVRGRSHHSVTAECGELREWEFAHASVSCPEPILAALELVNPTSLATGNKAAHCKH